MSRTNHNSKGCGYEYWSRRAFGPHKEFSRPGRFTKTLTHRYERRKGKQEVEIEEDEDSFFEIDFLTRNADPYDLKWIYMTEKNLVCEECSSLSGDLVNGWFYNSDKNNEFAKGTVSASLIQNKCLCKKCFKLYHDNKLLKCSEEAFQEIYAGMK